MSLLKLGPFMRKIDPVPALVKITLVKSAVRAQKDIQKTLTSLGLTKIHASKVHKNISPIRGMINQVTKLN
jgi:ribosomal protein L30